MAHPTLAEENARLRDENARLRSGLEQANRDRAESREQQAATAEILKVIGASPADIQPVFDAIVETGLRLCASDNCEVLLPAGDMLRSVASAGVRPELRSEIPISAGSVSGRAFVERRTNQVEDLQSLTSSEYPAAHTHQQEHGQRTVLAVPLRRRGEPIGVIVVVRLQPLLFSEAQVALIETFADQAVIAIENARLFNELEQRNHDLAGALAQQTATSEVLQIISSSPSDELPVLKAIVWAAVRLNDAVSAALWLRDGEMIRSAAFCEAGGEPWLADHHVFPLSSDTGPAQSVIREGRALQIEDVAALDEEIFSLARAGLVARGVRSSLTVPMLAESGAIGALAVHRDTPSVFTERQVALAETFAAQAAIAIKNARLFKDLQQANAAKSQFLSTMSHELRTPLNAVIGYSELLREEAQDEGLAGMVPDLVRINAAGKHLLSLINNVLDISKIEAGRMELELQDFAGQDVLAEVEAVVPPLMASNGNRFVLAVDGDLGMVHTDKTKLRQCLLNLLSNAAKFTEQGAVTLAVRRVAGDDGERLVFTVADTGIGMTERQLGRLFQSFTQAETGTASRYGGTGLGLSLSREFARLMGGDITVGSEPGKGSTFTLTVPAAVTPPALAEPR